MCARSLLPACDRRTRSTTSSWSVQEQRLQALLLNSLAECSGYEIERLYAIITSCAECAAAVTTAVIQTPGLRLWQDNVQHIYRPSQTNVNSLHR